MTDIRKKPASAEQPHDEAATFDDAQINHENPPYGVDAGMAGEALDPPVGETVEAPTISIRSWTDEQVRELKDQALRLMADMENLRKRHDREMDDARKYAMTGFARDLLEVVDNLGRALQAVPPDERGRNSFLDTLVTGVEMTQRTLLGTFEKHKIQQVVPNRGERFDHNRHQAMFEVPTNDLPAGSVADVIQPGYVLAERLLRPALVGVAKAAPQGMPGQAPQGGGTVDTSA
ncbi:MAG: nucleotide exchange factor GrpE [Geminicoccaceae bacterium]